MSFALTTEQVRARTKTVTRRLGWANAKPGEIVQPVVKGQGLKKGETVEKIGGPIRFVAVRPEPLAAILDAPDDPRLEGFPDMDGWDFIRMFCKHHGCVAIDRVNRIEFEYVEATC